MRFRRLSAFVLSIAVLLASLMPAYATSRGVDDAVINHVVVPFERMVTTSVESIGRMLGSVQDESFKLIRNCYEFWSGLISEAVLDYDGFVSDLDRTDASNGTVVTGFSVSTFNNSYGNAFTGVSNLAKYGPAAFIRLLESLGVNRSVAIYGISANSPYNMLGLYFDAAGCLRLGIFSNPLGSYNAAALGVYLLSDLTLIESLICDFRADGSLSSNSGGIYYSTGYAQSSSDFLTKSCLAFDFSTPFKMGTNYYCFTAYEKLASSSTWSDEMALYLLRPLYSVNLSLFDADALSWDNSRIIVQPSETDASSRTSSLMQTIHTYNTNNSYVDNSTNVNFFLVPSGEDPTEDTVVSPVIYDEETLVYTDPVTGTQYLTNGWTYDYLTRCYTLDMADESYKIGDTVIDTIKLTYGDELLTVDHYSGGSLIQSDKYNYVMLSGSACAIDGHTYNVETTKEPTCTAVGERTYTCSVCGNQYVEEIPQTDHIYADFTVVHEATCTSKGITSYTCSTCGGEYTELLEALGHDWQPTAATEEAYVMPDNVHCPDCYGESFTFERNDLETIPGKNLFDISQVSVQEENLSDTWISETGPDYFVITTPSSYSGNGYASTGIKLRDFAPNLEVGKTYSFSFSSDAFDWRNCVYLFGSDRFLYSGWNFITFTEADLNSILVFYGFPSSGTCKIFNVQIEAGSVVTEYEPYNPDYIEIIPPIYTFTCSDCSTVWTKEAVFQGSSVTFSCTRCGAEKIEVEEIPLEEEGWFNFMSDLIKSFFSSIVGAVGSGLSALLSAVVDFFGWIFGFLTDAVLIGVRNFFDSFSDDSSIFDGFKQENEDGSTTVVLPSGVATVFQFFSGTVLLLPDDLRLVLIFGVAALFLIAVFKLRP